jgi:hypothetical protein
MYTNATTKPVTVYNLVHANKKNKEGREEGTDEGEWKKRKFFLFCF